MSEAKRVGPYPAEVRERAVRMVFDHQHEYPSQWKAIHRSPIAGGATTGRDIPLRDDGVGFIVADPPMDVNLFRALRAMSYANESFCSREIPSSTAHCASLHI